MAKYTKEQLKNMSDEQLLKIKEGVDTKKSSIIDNILRKHH